MKIGNFDLVARAMAARTNLVTQRDVEKFHVTIGGRYQDEEVDEAIRPVVVAILNRRIAEIDEDLRSLGVVVDG